MRIWCLERVEGRRSFQQLALVLQCRSFLVLGHRGVELISCDLLVFREYIVRNNM